MPSNRAGSLIQPAPSEEKRATDFTSRVRSSRVKYDLQVKHKREWVEERGTLLTIGKSFGEKGVR